MMNPPQTPQLPTTAPEPEIFIGRKEIARRMGKGLRTIDQYLHDNRIPFYRVGSSILFRWTEVQQHLRDTCRVWSGKN